MIFFFTYIQQLWISIVKTKSHRFFFLLHTFHGCTFDYEKMSPVESNNFVPKQFTFLIKCNLIRIKVYLQNLWLVLARNDAQKVRHFFILIHFHYYTFIYKILNNHNTKKSKIINSTWIEDLKFLLNFLPLFQRFTFVNET